MARIRSVHPSLFTDERWVSCSPTARLLYIGLLTEADDQGLFEWKPVQIKIRLMPVDNADITELLDELAGADLIARVESAGKQLGAVRKFLRFQRPKKPNRQFVLPPEFRTYVGLDEASSGLDADEAAAVPPKEELAEQKEDGGDKMEEGEKKKPSPPVPAARRTDVDALWEATPKPAKERSSRKDVENALTAAVRRGHDPPKILAAIKAYYASPDATKQGGQFARGCHRMIQDDRWLEWAHPSSDLIRSNGLGIVDPSERQQRAWCRDFIEKPFQWKPHERGPRPGERGCRVSAAILAEFGLAEETAA
jgi:hypothetical protein